MLDIDRLFEKVDEKSLSAEEAFDAQRELNQQVDWDIRNMVPKDERCFPHNNYRLSADD